MIKLLKGSLRSILTIAMAAFAPITAIQRAQGYWQRWGAIVIHGIAVILGIAVLAILQSEFQIQSLVRSSLPIVRLTWLPLVGTLVYAIAWSAWFVARTLRMPAEKTLEGSIAAAWRYGLDRLNRAGIDVTRTPLYLILGSPAGGIRDFFAASHTDLIVVPTDEEAHNPIQVCGNREAIYVCCRQASLLGDYTVRAAQAYSAHRENTLLDKSVSVSRQPAHQWQPSFAKAHAGPTPVAQHTHGSGESHEGETAVAVASTITRNAPDADHATLHRVQETVTLLETLTTTEPHAQPLVLQPTEKKQTALRLEPMEAAELLERLDGLCRVISDTRQPYCPINGIVVMIPLAATERIETADHVGMRIERDLITIAEATQTSVSAQVIFCDLQHCEGSESFLHRFPDTQRHRRLGAILPATPASEPEAGPAAIDAAVRWICDDLFPPVAYRMLHRDIKDQSHDRALQKDNRGIHTLVDSMRNRRHGMSRMLRRAITSTAGKVRLRGCFVAATGGSGESKKAFAEGVMPLILDVQNEVQWSPLCRNRDRMQWRVAIAVYASVIATSVATVLLILNAN